MTVVLLATEVARRWCGFWEAGQQNSTGEQSVSRCDNNAAGGHIRKIPTSQALTGSRHAAARDARAPLLCYCHARPWFRRTKHAIEPCLPRPANEPPSGPNWIHETKHDVHQDGDHPHNRPALMRRHSGQVDEFTTRNGGHYFEQAKTRSAATQRDPEDAIGDRIQHPKHPCSLVP